MTRGYFGIGIYHTKTEQNVGGLFRSALNLGADFIFTIVIHPERCMYLLGAEDRGFSGEALQRCQFLT